MKTIIRNLLSVLRRFKMATLLNVLGLSIAFAAFMVIMMQVDYDRNFDKFHKEANRIYRLEMKWGDDDGLQAVLSRPLADAFFNFSPHIVAGALTYPMYSQTVFLADVGTGERSAIWNRICRSILRLPMCLLSICWMVRQRLWKIPRRY